MSFSAFVNFAGDCRQAVEFYADVFGVTPTRIMTYGEAPGMEVAPEDQDRVLYASLPVAGVELMLSDCPTGFPHDKGNGVALVIGSPERAEIMRLYERLSTGGTIHMPLEQTFFSELFAHFSDKFGVLWQLSLEPAS